ncbi:MAG TPA: hypothetical protein VKY26_05625 [Actinomycetota bacterium]|nr:hypothetical protein [Actinomycetota bacterium]
MQTMPEGAEPELADALRHPHDANWISKDIALQTLGDGARVLCRRDPAVATLFISDTALLSHVEHQWINVVGMIYSAWLGREALHAGAFSTTQGAWGVVAEREGGKSSTLASLATFDHGIVADDLAVVESNVVFAGPRQIDLRLDAADWLQGLSKLAVSKLALSRGATRRRLALLPIPPTSTLVGWIFLTWGAEVALRTIPPSQRFVRLTRALALRPHVGSPKRLMELAELPGWELVRPRNLDFFFEGLGLVQDLVGD